MTQRLEFLYIPHDIDDCTQNNKIVHTRKYSFCEDPLISFGVMSNYKPKLLKIC